MSSGTNRGGGRGTNNTGTYGCGMRKTRKINALKRLNERCRVGLRTSDIESMSMPQLRRITASIKKAYGMTVHGAARYSR